MENREHGDVLEEYRVNTYGNTRSDFDMCDVALNDAADMVALVYRALDGIDEATTNNEHAQVLMAAHRELGRALEIINKSLTVLADCEVA